MGAKDELADDFMVFEVREIEIRFTEEFMFLPSLCLSLFGQLDYTKNYPADFH